MDFGNIREEKRKAFQNRKRKKMLKCYPQMITWLYPVLTDTIDTPFIIFACLIQQARERMLLKLQI